MSSRLTRRGLFGGLVDSLRSEPANEKPAPAPRGFSLESFYAARDPGPAALPVVVVREGLPLVATSSVGVCPPIEVLDDEGDLA